MQTSELEAIVMRLRKQGTDDDTVEVKRTEGSLGISVWESVSAFGNTHGGTILLGLDEKNNFAVMPNFNLERVRDQFVSGIGDGGEDNAVVVNPPQYEMSRVSFEGGQVLAIELAEVDVRFKPCYIKKKDMHNGAYKRVDDKDVKLSATEIFELQNALYPSAADRETVDEATIDDLDLSIVDSLIARERQRGAKSLRGASTRESQMSRLNITDKNNRVRLAGLLSTGYYPQQYYPKLVVDVAVHPGTEKSMPGERRFLDRVICDGSLGEVIVDAVHAVMRNLQTYSIVRGTGRVDVPEIPEEVLREAIANAVLHREYSSYFTGQAVSVDVYSDRVVITNPGSLWGGKTLKNIADGVSKCRNDTLMRLMTSIPLPGGSGITAEGQGSGILFMINEMQSRALETPRFEAGFDSFTVILGRGGSEIAENRRWISEVSGLALSNQEETALIIVRRLGKATAADLRNELHIDSDDARHLLDELSAKGLVECDDNEAYRISEVAKTTPSSMTSAEAILSVLSQDTPLLMRQIEKETGRKITTLRGAMKKLVDDGLVIAIGKSTSTTRRYILPASTNENDTVADN